MINKFKSLADMLEKLPDDESCRKHLEELRWNNTPVCPHCGAIKPYQLKTRGVFKGLYKCSDCKERFTVSVGTMFEGSHIGYRKWFIAIYIFQSHKKGISSYQLSRDLGITQKSAWFVLHRIRTVMKDKLQEKLTVITEIDETFVGGKNKNRHYDKKVKHSQGRSFKDKTPVIGFMNDGKVRCFVIKDTMHRSIVPKVLKNVEKGSVIVTDEWRPYKQISHLYHHEIVHHAAGIYVNENSFTTNTIEGFWTWIKRTYNGTYHKISRKHLQNYVDECSFRYNNRKISDSERFNLVLLSTKDVRLTYEKLVA